MEGIGARKMRFEDIEEVIGLEKRVFDNPWTRGVFKSEISSGRRTIYLVAEGESRILGFIGARLHGPEMHVTNMAVDSGSRRRGIGSFLLRECVALALRESVEWATLEVRCSNEQARRFYRGIGFRELGLRKGYYQDTDEDAVMMSAPASAILCAGERGV